MACFILLGFLIIGQFVSEVSAFVEDFYWSGPPEIAIDLGNTYSCVAGYEKGEWEKTFQICIPSWVAFTDNDTLVGDAAVNHSAVDPERTFSGFRRFLGLWRYDEDVKRGGHLVPYKTVFDSDRCHCIQLQTKDGFSYPLYLIAAKVISKLKEDAEAHLGRKITNVVVTLPAHSSMEVGFMNAKAACIVAGLRIPKILVEPTAVAIAYGLDKKLRHKGNVLVFHLGGGTASASIVTLYKNGEFDITAVHQEPYLGGRDFDERIVDHFVDLIKKNHEKDVSKDKGALAKLRTAGEHAKKALSRKDHVWVEIESLVHGVDFSEPLTRAKFEELNNDLFLKAIKLVENVMRSAEEVSKELIDEIVLVGGSTRIPKIQKLLKDYFDGRELNTRLEPDETIAYGAALLTHPTLYGHYADQCMGGSW